LRQTFISVIVLLNSFLAAQTGNDTLIDKLSSSNLLKNNPGTQQVFIDVTDRFAENFQFREIVTLSNQILRDKEKIKSKLFIATIYNSLGLNYWKLGELDSALSALNNSIAILKPLKDTAQLGRVHNNLGVLYWRNGDLLNSFINYSLSLKYREEVKDYKGIVLVLNNLGLIYQRLKYYDFAVENILRAERLADSIGYTFGVAYSYKRFASIYLEIDDHERFLLYANEAMGIFDSLNALDDMAEMYNNFGIYYLKKKNYQRAENYFSKSFNIAVKIKDKFVQANSLNLMGEAYILLPDYVKALEVLTKSLELSLAKEYKVITRNNYRQLSKLYKNINEPAVALSYLEKYNMMSDTVLNERIINSINDFQTKQLIKQSEETKQRLLLENQLNLEKFEFQKKRNTFYLVMILLILVALVSIVFLYLKQKRLRKSILSSNIELEKLNTQLNSTNNELLEANKTKDRIFSIIAHDLRSPFHSLLSFSEILKSDIKILSQKEIETFAENINESSQRILSLVQNLLEWASSQLDEISANPVEFNISDVIKSSLDIYLKIALTKQIEIVNKVDGMMNVYADKNMIDSVFRNLISNAIKFTETSGRVEISATVSDSKVVICVSDTGVGIEKDTLDKLFDPLNHISTFGTKKEAGTGLGLNLCKEFLEKNKGSIWVESKPGAGSKFFIAIPNSKRD